MWDGNYFENCDSWDLCGGWGLCFGRGVWGNFLFWFYWGIVNNFCCIDLCLYFVDVLGCSN